MKHYSIVTEPAYEPVTVSEMVNMLGLGGSTEELSLLSSYISTARERVTNYTGRAMVKTEFLLVSDSWSGGEITWTGDMMKIDRMPLSASGVSVKYYPYESTTLTTLTEGTDYIVLDKTTPGMVMLLIEPPQLADRPDAVQIQFFAGHEDVAAISPMLKQAVRELAAHYFELRLPVNVGNIVNEIPFGLRDLLDGQRIGGWFG